MRRFAAILLVAMFSFSLIAPAALADSASTMPACCRRSGRHHCANHDSHASSTSDVAVQRARCSEFPSVKALPGNRSFELTAGSPAIAVLVRLIAYRAPWEAPASHSYSRAGQKRGPPFFLQ
jgi:hypothetical protein